MAKERVLTEKEQKRLDSFNEVSASMEADGYKKTELTVNILNVFHNKPIEVLADSKKLYVSEQ